MTSMMWHVWAASIQLAVVGYATSSAVARFTNSSLQDTMLPTNTPPTSAKQVCDGAPLQVPRASSERWVGRAIYFIVTDRFAQSDPSSDSAPFCEGKEWCGGTFRGIQRKLDYIQNMGFDAIWITPVVKQVEWRDKYNGTAYHGYWASNFYEIDPHLGSEDDLLALRVECERRGILFMLDVVANHAGPIGDISQVPQLGPHLNYTDGRQFHQLYRRPSQSFQQYIKRPVQANDAFDRCGPDNYVASLCFVPKVIVDGWIGDLADINQEDPETQAFLTDWIQFMARKYRVDGFRLDTVYYMPHWFVRCFQNAAGIFMIGELRSSSMGFHRIWDGDLSGLLNFPLGLDLADHFGQNGSMMNLLKIINFQNNFQYRDQHLLGNFADNHDQERFLYRVGGDVSRLKNGVTFVMLYHGIPIIYQGTEQVEVSNVANEPDVRRSMWPNYGTSNLYNFLAQLNALRRKYGLTAGGKNVRTPAEVVVAKTRHLMFVRGQLLVSLTNIGQEGSALFCIEVKSFPSPWNDVCKGKEFEIVLGNTSNTQCNENQFCFESVDGGPVVFALAEQPVVLIF